MANLAAHLCSYEVVKINPSPISAAQTYKLDTFKADLVSAYTRAGVKVGKIKPELIIHAYIFFIFNQSELSIFAAIVTFTLELIDVHWALVT